jgi:hypothetical protein
MWRALAYFFCSAHVGTGSGTTVEQESQQVRASGIDSPEHYDEHNTPHDFTVYEEESEFSRREIDLDGIETSSSFQKSYHAQSEENARLNWSVQRRIQTMSPNPN